jgi:membrane protein implicated in regulation of membrane protease activity
VYVLTDWKRRAAYLVFALGLGTWLALVTGWPLALTLVVALAIALLKIWREVRKYEGRR